MHKYRSISSNKLGKWIIIVTKIVYWDHALIKNNDIASLLKIDHRYIYIVPIWTCQAYFLRWKIVIRLWDCWRWCQLVLSIWTNLIKTHQQPTLDKPKRFGNTSSNTVARIAPCRFLGDALCTALITMTGESMDLCDRGYLIYDALKPLSDNHCCVHAHKLALVYRPLWLYSWDCL